MTHSPSDEWECHHCGEIVEPFDFVVEGQQYWMRRQYCTCERAQKEKAAAERKINRDEIVKWVASLEDKGYLPSEQNWRLPTWDKTAPNLKNGLIVWDGIQRYLDGLNNGGKRWLYLAGEYGLGKTHLAAGIAKRMAALNFWRVRFVVWADVLTEIKASWGTENRYTEQKYWESLKAAPLVVIDDLDKAYPTPWAMEKLYIVLDHRYQKNMATVFTANRNIAGLRQYWRQVAQGNESKQGAIRDMGDAFLDRLRGKLNAQIVIEGVSYR